MSLTDADLLLAALKILQANKTMRVNPNIPLRSPTHELAGLLEWTIREVAESIARLRDEGHLIANFGGGYYIAESRHDMEATLKLYKGRAMTALCRLKKMQDATDKAFPEDEQRDFFKEAIDEI